MSNEHIDDLPTPPKSVTDAVSERRGAGDVDSAAAIESEWEDSVRDSEEVSEEEPSPESVTPPDDADSANVTNPPPDLTE